MKKIRLFALVWVLICFYNKLFAQLFFISASGQTEVQCPPLHVTVSVSNPNPNYTYWWYYIMFETYTFICTDEVSATIGQGTSILISPDNGLDYHFAVVCEARDINNTPVAGSNRVNFHRNVTKVPHCISTAGYSCGEKLIELPSSLYSGNIQWFKNGSAVSSQGYYLSYLAKSTGYYYARVQTGTCGYAFTDSVYVSVNNPSAQITPSGTTVFCQGGSVVLNAVVAANRTYQWKKGANLISGATLSSYTATTGGNYRVIVTNTATGCSKTTASPTVVTVNAKPAATITPQGPTTFCAGGSVVLKANSGAGLTYKWKKGGNYISGATLLNYTATTAGTYRVEVTNSNACSKLSPVVTVTVPCRVAVPIAIGIDFSVYPNPNSGEFTINFSAKPAYPIQIELTDEIGKVVKRFETSDETVVIKESNLAKGIYCLTVRNKDKVVVKKISIVK